MNRDRTPELLGFALIVTALATAGCQSDRQMIFNAPRSRAAPVEKPNAIGKLDLPAKDSVPKPRSLPPSNGIDVPIINHD